MDLLEQTKYLIKKTGLTPDKLKGQNFCIDENVLSQMVKTAGIKKSDTVLEVGPGFGFLTQELVKLARKVIAVELDKKLFANLKNLSEVVDNLKVVNKDILKITNNQLPITNYKIVSNLPYGISSAFLKKFLTAEKKPQSITLLLQKEVAERICAPVGEMSLLSVSVQLYCQPEIIADVGHESFYPAPNVESAIIHFKNIIDFPFSEEIEEKKYWQMVRAGFCSKRKTIENNLANSFHFSKEKTKKIIEKSGIKPVARAQELSVKDWLSLSIEFAEISE